MLSLVIQRVLFVFGTLLLVTVLELSSAHDAAKIQRIIAYAAVLMIAYAIDLIAHDGSRIANFFLYHIASAVLFVVGGCMFVEILASMGFRTENAALLLFSSICLAASGRLLYGRSTRETIYFRNNEYIVFIAGFVFVLTLQWIVTINNVVLDFLYFSVVSLAWVRLRAQWIQADNDWKWIF